MEFETLKTAAETITMPGDTKRRIVENCKTQISDSGKETVMKNKFVRKPAAVFAAAALCLSLSVTALAATGTLQGFFKDITNWQGAIVGTSYEQATEEINICVSVNGNALTVLTTFADPQMAPYTYAERLGIAQYRIEDDRGNVVKEGTAKSAEVVNGHANISLPLDDISSGSYKLIVTAFVSEKKADQPLNIQGNWECAFTK